MLPEHGCKRTAADTGWLEVQPRAAHAARSPSHQPPPRRRPAAPPARVPPTRQLSILVHPDKNPGEDARQAFEALNEAHRALKDASKLVSAGGRAGAGAGAGGASLRAAEPPAKAAGLAAHSGGPAQEAPPKETPRPVAPAEV